MNIVEVNIEVLKGYTQLLEREERNQSIMSALLMIRDAAKTGHIILTGKGGCKKEVEERAKMFKEDFALTDSYGYRAVLCHHLTKAIQSTTQYEISCDSYLDLTAYATAWVSYLNDKQRKSDAYLGA